MPRTLLLRNYHGRLERRQFVPCARSEVFTFFADAKNLETITGFLCFHTFSRKINCHAVRRDDRLRVETFPVFTFVGDR